MSDRDINFNNVDPLHHVHSLSRISDHAEERKNKKDKEKNEQTGRETTDIDEKLEEDLQHEEEEIKNDDDMEHIDFRA